MHVATAGSRGVRVTGSPRARAAPAAPRAPPKNSGANAVDGRCEPVQIAAHTVRWRRGMRCQW